MELPKKGAAFRRRDSFSSSSPSPPPKRRRATFNAGSASPCPLCFAVNDCDHLELIHLKQNDVFVCYDDNDLSTKSCFVDIRDAILYLAVTSTSSDGLDQNVLEKLLHPPSRSNAVVSYCKICNQQVHKPPIGWALHCAQCPNAQKIDYCRVCEQVLVEEQVEYHLSGICFPSTEMIDEVLHKVNLGSSQRMSYKPSKNVAELIDQKYNEGQESTDDKFFLSTTSAMSASTFAQELEDFNNVESVRPSAIKLTSMEDLIETKSESLECPPERNTKRISIENKSKHKKRDQQVKKIVLTCKDSSDASCIADPRLAAGSAYLEHQSSLGETLQETSRDPRIAQRNLKRVCSTNETESSNNSDDPRLSVKPLNSTSTKHLSLETKRKSIKKTRPNRVPIWVISDQPRHGEWKSHVDTKKLIPWKMMFRFKCKVLNDS